MKNYKIVNLATPTVPSDAVTKSYADGLSVGGGPVTSDFDVNNFKVINLATPTVGTDATTKTYVDGIAKQPTSSFTFVNQASDFGTPSTNVYTLLDNHTYWITTTVDLTGDRLVCGQNTVIRGSSSENSLLKSTGLTGTALISSAYSLPMLNLTIEADTALDLDASGNANQAIDWNGVNFNGCSTIGSIANYTNVIWVNCAILSSANLTFDGSIDTVGWDGCIAVGIAGQTTIILPATLTINRRFRLIYSAIVAFGGATGIDVNASTTLPTEGFILDTVSFSGGATYVNGLSNDDNVSFWVNNTGVGNSFSTALMTMSGNSTATTISASTTPVLAAGTTTLDTTVSSKFSMPQNNRLRYDGAVSRQFRVTGTATLTSGNNVQVGIHFAKNGTKITTSEVFVTTDGGGKRENTFSQTVVNLVDTDYIELFVENDTNTSNITVSELNIIIEALN